MKKANSRQVRRLNDDSWIMLGDCSIEEELYLRTTPSSLIRRCSLDFVDDNDLDDDNDQMYSGNNGEERNDSGWRFSRSIPNDVSFYSISLLKMSKNLRFYIQVSKLYYINKAFN